jgi:hypothetical protein
VPCALSSAWLLLLLLWTQGALTVLKDLAAYPHLANGDYADVNREIKKIITKDSNIQVGRGCCCGCLHSTAQLSLLLPTDTRSASSDTYARLKSGRGVSCMADVTVTLPLHFDCAGCCRGHELHSQHRQGPAAGLQGSSDDAVPRCVWRRTRAGHVASKCQAHVPLHSEQQQRPAALAPPAGVTTPCMLYQSSC